MSITTSAIVQEYGAYYMDAGQNKKRILNLLSQGREFTDLATPIRTDDTIFRLANATFRTLVQPFQKTFTPAQKMASTVLSNLRVELAKTGPKLAIVGVDGTIN